MYSEFLGKLRHQDTHKFKIHQLGVWVEGWRPIPPISVDKVGIYFRQATPDSQRSVSFINLCHEKLSVDALSAISDLVCH